MAKLPWYLRLTGTNVTKNNELEYVVIITPVGQYFLKLKYFWRMIWNYKRRLRD